MKLPTLLLAVLAPSIACAVEWDVTLDAAQVHQPIDGFGASSAWYEDEYYAMPDANRAAFVREIFDVQDGLGLSIYRVRVPPEDTGDVREAPFIDWKDPDRIAMGKFVREVQDAYRPFLMASIWSPPGWMKDTGQKKGEGRLLKERYADYATFLGEWVLGMKREFGVEIDAFSFQNEPGVHKWESCEWTTDEMREFLAEHLIPTFLRMGLIHPPGSGKEGVKLIANENEQWNDKQLNELLDDPRIAPHIDIAAAHVYSHGGFPNQPFAKAAAAGKPVWQTELYHKGADGRASDTIAYGLLIGRLVHNMLVNNAVNAYNFWWIASPEDKNIQALIDLTDDNTGHRVMKQGYAFAHYSRFIRPGFRRVAITPAFPAADPDASLDPKALASMSVALSAFQNPANGELVVVAINDSNEDVTLNLTVTGAHGLKEFTATRTTAERNLARVDSVPVTNNSARLVLPASSITTYSGS